MEWKKFPRKERNRTEMGKGNRRGKLEDQHSNTWSLRERTEKMRERDQISFKASCAFTILKEIIFFLEFYPKLNYCLKHG